MMMQYHHLSIVTVVMALASLLATQACAEDRTNRIKIEYRAPFTNRIKIEYRAPLKAQQNHVYEIAKNDRILERVQQIFGAVRLPIDLSVKMKTCGIANAWYQRQHEDAEVTICYEYLAHIYANVPKGDASTGVTPVDAVEGQVAYLISHEMGHAMFDLLDIPIFGSPEVAADQFATYIMLAFGPEDARRLIRGAAFSYQQIMAKPDLDIKMKQFSDAHGSSPQRYYNMLCLAYGARPQVFADVVERGVLPKERARDCNYEYQELAYAFRKLVRPNLDPVLVQQVLHTEWLPPEPEEKPRRP